MAYFKNLFFTASLVDNVTEDNANPISEDLLLELAKQSFEGSKNYEKYLEELFTKLKNNSFNVKVKAIQVMKYLVQHGHPLFQQMLQDRDKELKAVTEKLPEDNNGRMVRDNLTLLINILYDTHIRSLDNPDNSPVNRNMLYSISTPSTDESFHDTKTENYPTDREGQLVLQICNPGVGAGVQPPTRKQLSDFLTQISSYDTRKIATSLADQLQHHNWKNRLRALYVIHELILKNIAVDYFTGEGLVYLTSQSQSVQQTIRDKIAQILAVIPSPDQIQRTIQNPPPNSFKPPVIEPTKPVVVNPQPEPIRNPPPQVTVAPTPTPQTQVT